MPEDLEVKFEAERRDRERSRFDRILPPRNRAERILVIVLAGLVVILLIGLVIAWREPAPYNPLSFEPQRIELVDPTTGEVTVPTVTGFEGIPAIRLGDRVPTTGVRCVDENEEIDVVANVWWVRSAPSGERVQTVEGLVRTVEPGCVPLRFENVIPQEVADSVIETGRAQQWRIVGDATPTRSGGVPAAWQTESFWILPE